MREQCQTNKLRHSNRKYFRDCFVHSTGSRPKLTIGGAGHGQSQLVSSLRARLLSAGPLFVSCERGGLREGPRPSRERRRHRQWAQTPTEHAYAHIVLMARYDDSTKLIGNFDDYPVFPIPTPDPEFTYNQPLLAILASNQTLLFYVALLSKGFQTEMKLASIKLIGWPTFFCRVMSRNSD